MSVPNNYEDKLPKIEENMEEDTPKEAVEGEEEYQRSKRNRIANRQYQDYKLCVTVEEQEDRLDHEENDLEKMLSVAHYIMMHYAEKKIIKKKRKKKYKPKAGQYTSLEAGLKHFGEM
jgi:hypothetical protein